MQKTVAGLPNSCSVCGAPVSAVDGWFAENEDVARSGGGVCGKHVSPAGHELYVMEAGQAEQKPVVSTDNASTVGGTETQTDVIVPEHITHAKRTPVKKQAK